MSILFAGRMAEQEQAEWLAQLRAALPEEQWLTERSPSNEVSIDIAVAANPAPGALQGLPSLRFIQSLWAGVDGLMRDTTLPAGVPLARMVDSSMNAAMAETALWAVLSLHRDFFEYAAQQRAGRWLQHLQQRADEVTVAVLGLGQMGRTVAQRLAAQGYRVIGWSAHATTLEGIEARHGDPALPEVLGAADIVVNLLPLTPATRGLFDARRFGQMRRGARLVNLARGDHVIEGDLLAALDDGRLRHAVLDVFHTEPLPPDHAFWSHPRVTMLPHVAAATDSRSAAGIVAENVRALRAGRPLKHLVERGRGY
jgi:glyoxylate/hydroxypyruvate reductase A